MRASANEHAIRAAIGPGLRNN
ncbi:protein of unknown function (plasmid) [Cupriavidus taiwanensis]|uniref:Uncharacterized protein n=1 Tax=Cupriavidus taiwanensis TaxID=164546 RepID=A0A375ISH2_9BURK|nr:protein of unknown function [Cupriavidus taiwanensis]